MRLVTAKSVAWGTGQLTRLSQPSSGRHGALANVLLVGTPLQGSTTSIDGDSVVLVAGFRASGMPAMMHGKLVNYSWSTAAARILVADLQLPWDPDAIMATYAYTIVKAGGVIIERKITAYNGATRAVSLATHLPVPSGARTRYLVMPPGSVLQTGCVRSSALVSPHVSATGVECLLELDMDDSSTSSDYAGKVLFILRSDGKLSSVTPDCSWHTAYVPELFMETKTQCGAFTLRAT